jgi:replicative superfamily II helicase
LRSADRAVPSDLPKQPVEQQAEPVGSETANDPAGDSPPPADAVRARLEPAASTEVTLTGNLTMVGNAAGCLPVERFSLTTFPFSVFNPMQSAALEYAVLDVNLVVAAPTSAGKTVVAEMVLHDTLRKGKKGIFLSPLKAVTQEKYDEWLKPATGQFANQRVSIVTGDYQLSKERRAELAAAEVILLTSEMLDSRTRRMQQEGNAWLLDTGVLVCDEAHLLTMEERGHALESGIMRFTSQNRDARIVLLSATMPNVDELGRWLTSLNGKHTVVVRSEWRPVPHETHHRPYPARGLRYYERESSKVDTALQMLTGEFRSDKLIVFVHTKSAGRQLLARLRDRGVPACFHNADLDTSDRLAIERAFRTV